MQVPGDNENTGYGSYDGREGDGEEDDYVDEEDDDNGDDE